MSFDILTPICTFCIDFAVEVAYMRNVTTVSLGRSRPRDETRTGPGIGINYAIYVNSTSNYDSRAEMFSRWLGFNCSGTTSKPLG